jgi:hypothetical protein
MVEPEGMLSLILLNRWKLYLSSVCSRCGDCGSEVEAVDSAIVMVVETTTTTKDVEPCIGWQPGFERNTGERYPVNMDGVNKVSMLTRKDLTS